MKKYFGRIVIYFSPSLEVWNLKTRVETWTRKYSWGDSWEFAVEEDGNAGRCGHGERRLTKQRQTPGFVLRYTLTITITHHPQRAGVCSNVCPRLTLSCLTEEWPEFPNQARLVLQLWMEKGDLAAQGFIWLLHAPLPTQVQHISSEHFNVMFKEFVAHAPVGSVKKCF